MKLTHPDITSFVTHLRCAKRGKNATSFFYCPLFAVGKETTGQRSSIRESWQTYHAHYYGRYLRPGLSAHTAQALATGRYPLLSLTQKKLFLPLSAIGEERVGQRSVAGVSKIINMLYAGNNQIFLS